MQTDSVFHVFESLLNAKVMGEMGYFFLAFTISCIAAGAELCSRYTDGPGKIFSFPESYFYLAVNGLAGCMAYWATISWGINSNSTPAHSIATVILSSCAAMVILRSSLANVKNGEKTFSAGLAPILQIFLDTADRAFDRKRSEITLKEIKNIMQNIDFEKAAKDLPATCFSIMQNISSEEKEVVGRQVQQIGNAEFESNLTKVINLGIVVSQLTGNDLLKSVVDSLGNEILLTPDGDEVLRDAGSFSAQQAKIRNLKKQLLLKMG